MNKEDFIQMDIQLLDKQIKNAKKQERELTKRLTRLENRKRLLNLKL